ncbi:hypothetical protein ACFW9I_33880 [[Kitasatospora] papulosa]|uniref:hypothetical protein n=1 Tax=[Kitasatospora] papulosa TaxID=1464011 RepID=UPI0036B31D55
MPLREDELNQRVAILRQYIRYYKTVKPISGTDFCQAIGKGKDFISDAKRPDASRVWGKLSPREQVEIEVMSGNAGGCLLSPEQVESKVEHTLEERWRLEQIDRRIERIERIVQPGTADMFTRMPPAYGSIVQNFATALAAHMEIDFVEYTAARKDSTAHSLPERPDQPYAGQAQAQPHARRSGLGRS